MARPISKGIDYFPLDVGFMNNLKVRKVIQACGPNSIAIIMLLLGNIYGDEGYYMRWDEDVCFLITEALGVKDVYALETVKKCLQVGLFNEDLFNKHQIITSKGIQRRYFEITKRRKNQELIPEFLLINVAETGVIVTETHDQVVNVAETGVNVAETGVIVNNNRVVACKSTQRKEKESKEKKSKTNTNNIFISKIKNYTSDQDLINYLCMFVDVRNDLNKAFSPNSFDLFLKQLESLSNGDDSQKKDMLRSAILNKWVNVYPLKSSKASSMSSLDRDYFMTTERQTDGMSEDELKTKLGIRSKL